MNILASIFEDYFILRQQIPVIIYIFFIRFRNTENKIIDQIINTLLAFIAMISAYAFFGFMLKIPFSNLIPFNWTYQGLIHWGIFFFFFFQISIRKNMNKLKSFTLATMATVGGGWLYEIPIFNMEYVQSIFFTNYSIFYVNAQIMCLIFLALEIMMHGFKPNRMVYTTLFLFLIFSIPLFFDKTSIYHLYKNFLEFFNISWSFAHANTVKWFYRIPASLFLLSLLNGVKKHV